MLVVCRLVFVGLRPCWTDFSYFRDRKRSPKFLVSSDQLLLGVFPGHSHDERGAWPAAEILGIDRVLNSLNGF